MGRYIIVTETGGDIPAEFVERYGLEMVPMHVTFGERSLDDGSFPVADIFAHYRATGDLPRTSGCTPQDFADAFARIDACCTWRIPPAPPARSSRPAWRPRGAAT